MEAAIHFSHIGLHGFPFSVLMYEQAGVWRERSLFVCFIHFRIIIKSWLGRIANSLKRHRNVMALSLQRLLSLSSLFPPFDSQWKQNSSKPFFHFSNKKLPTAICQRELANETKATNIDSQKEIDELQISVTGKQKLDVEFLNWLQMEERIWFSQLSPLMELSSRSSIRKLPNHLILANIT